MYLLDTNVIGEIARNPQGDTAVRVAALAPEAFGINPIVACEIVYGLTKRGSVNLRRQIVAILEAISKGTKLERGELVAASGLIQSRTPIFSMAA